MKICVVHNYYARRGGEDAVFEAECARLMARGHEVVVYRAENANLSSVLDKAIVALGVVFSPRHYYRFLALLKEERPDIVHIHNLFPQISLAPLFACRRLGVPAVATVHNYRYLCPTATLFWNGSQCDRSIEKSHWWAVKSRVYRGSLIASLIVALLVAITRRSQFWTRHVAFLIMISRTQAEVFRRAGFEGVTMRFKPNAIELPAASELSAPSELRNFLFVGRLEREKGVHVLARAAKACPQFNFYIAGEGSCSDVFLGLPNVQLLGHLGAAAIAKLMQNSAALIFPSLWREGLPMTILESFSMGLPVIASGIGAAAELVSHNENGLLFPPDDSECLAHALHAIADDRLLRARLGDGARRTAVKYASDRNVTVLEQLYREAVSAVGGANAGQG